MAAAGGNTRVIESLMKWIRQTMVCADEAVCEHDLTHLETISGKKKKSPMRLRIESCHKWLSCLLWSERASVFLRILSPTGLYLVVCPTSIFFFPEFNMQFFGLILIPSRIIQFHSGADMSWLTTQYVIFVRALIHFKQRDLIYFYRLRRSGGDGNQSLCWLPLTL